MGSRTQRRNGARRLAGAIATLTCLGLAVPGAGRIAAQAGPPPAPLWRMNCGGPQVNPPHGPPFLADQPYDATTHGGFVGGVPNTWKPGEDLGPLLDPGQEVHTTARLGWKAYRRDVANGDYLLRLHFAEIDVNVEGPGLRRFSVKVEGTPVLVDLDLAALFGLRYAAQFVMPVTVSDGRLDVDVVPGGSPAILSAIEVWTLPAGAGLAPPPVTGLHCKDGYNRTILSWDVPSDPAVTGFRVSRAESPAGPFVDVGTTWAGPPRFLDAGASLAVPHWYRVAALGLSGAVGPAAQAGPAVAHVPADATLPVYELTIAPADLQTLNVTVLTDPEFEVPGVFTYEGVSHDVAVRYRGGGSLLASKKSWKVDFADNDLFDGRRKLNLKATFLDESLSIEPLAHVMFEAVGHPVPHQRRVHVFVNGEDRGVSNDMEQVDERYLAARDRDPTGSIYKGVKGGADFSLLPTLADYQNFYEKKTNESEPYDDLIALIELVNAPGTTPLQLADNFDLDGYLNYLAVIGWTADSDQGGRNFHLLHDHALQRWEWITWDNDRSMYSPEASITGATFQCEDCGGYNHLKQFVLADPGLRWRYCTKLVALMAGACSPAQMDGSIDALHAEMATDAAADTGKRGWENDALFDASPAQLSAFVPARNAWINSLLLAYQPAQPPTSLWINEFMADNTHTIADETGAFEDWLELYNADSAPLDCSGLYLTDDLSQPAQWRIPDGTSVPAHGHLLVWCDKDATDGPLHASFKLAAAGGEIGLVAADGATLLDVDDYREQMPDVAQGRTADGAAFFALLPTPTPLQPNTTLGNLPPLITWVEPDPASPSSGQPVTITAQVLDQELPLAVSVFWRVAGAGGAFTEAPMSPLEVNRWQAVLPAQPAGVQVQYYVHAQDALGVSMNEPTSAPDDLFTCGTPGNQPAGLRINEFLADNHVTLADEAGDHDDWIEIVNTSDALADLAGMFLSDDLTQTTQWAFPAGTQLAPGATLLVWADDEATEGPLHANFKLSKTGESVALFDAPAHGNALIDSVIFGPQTTDVTTGRLPDGGATIVTLLDPSPHAPNAPGSGQSFRYDALVPAATVGTFNALSAPLLGTTFTLQVGAAPPSSNGLLVIGLSVLHFDLGGNGVLLLNPLLQVLTPFATRPDGSAQVALPLPGNPALAGLLIELQAYVSGGGLSNAVAARIGP